MAGSREKADFPVIGCCSADLHIYIPQRLSLLRPTPSGRLVAAFLYIFFQQWVSECEIFQVI